MGVSKVSGAPNGFNPENYPEKSEYHYPRGISYTENNAIYRPQGISHSPY
jgi:hypothetical protein